MNNKEEELIKILSGLKGKSLGDVADKILALFNEPERWKPDTADTFFYVYADGTIRNLVF